MTESQLALDGNYDRGSCLKYVGTEGRRIAAEGTVRTLESWLIDEVSQRKDSLFRMSFRSFRYLQ